MIRNIVEVHFAEMTGAVATKQVSIATLHVSVVRGLSIFSKIKLLMINRDASNWHSLELFYFVSIISAFLVYYIVI